MTRTVPEVDPDLEQALRDLADTVATSTSERDRLIVEAYTQGAGLREIARAVAMSHPGVRSIILRDRGTLERT
jgi:DNA-directed RNA polymerase specialized sigma24 family protein